MTFDLATTLQGFFFPGNNCKVAAIGNVLKIWTNTEEYYIIQIGSQEVAAISMGFRGKRGSYTQVLKLWTTVFHRWLCLYLKGPCRDLVKIFTFLSETVTPKKREAKWETNQKKNFASPAARNSVRPLGLLQRQSCSLRLNQAWITHLFSEHSSLARCTGKILRQN